MEQNLTNTDVVILIEMKVLKKKFRVPQILTDSSHCAELQTDCSNKKKKERLIVKLSPNHPKSRWMALNRFSPEVSPRRALASWAHIRSKWVLNQWATEKESMRLNPFLVHQPTHYSYSWCNFPKLNVWQTQGKKAKHQKWYQNFSTKS